MTADWSELAATARREIDASRGSVADGFSPEARRAVTALMDAIAETEAPRVAAMGVTRWIITRRPIEECVQAEREAADERGE